MTACHLKPLLLALCACVFLLHSKANPQNKAVPLRDALKQVTKTYGTQFVYDPAVVNGKTTTYNFKTNTKKPVEDVLKGILYPNELVFLYISNNYYSIVLKDRLAEATQQENSSANLAMYNSISTITGKQLTISGTVRDSKGAALARVTVQEKGTNNTTITGESGNFSINVAGSQSVLVFSSIGFGAKEVRVGNQTNISVVLEQTDGNLDEVVVVGYGTMRKSDITGAVSSVKFNEKEAAQITSVDKLLQGRSPGVYVNTGSAAPGGAINVRIRGTSSFSGGSEPLYVVDGVIINTASQDVDNSLKAGTNPGNSYQEAQNGLTAINPQDIENIEILKDASATAIYGSRGANGVVLITTKQGKAGKAKVVYNTTTEFSRISKMMPMLDGVGFAHFRNKTEEMQGRPPVYDLSKIEPIDWQEDVFGTGVTTNNRVSISGKNDKTNYYLAAGYLNNEGIIPNTGLKQLDLRFNLTQDVSKNFRVSSKTGLIYRRNSMTQSTEQMGSASNSIIRQMLAKAPIRDTLGPNQTELDEDIEGPRAWLKDYDDISKEFRAIQSLSLEYKLSSDFAVRVLGGADLRFKDRHRWFGKVLGQGKAANGQLGYSALKNYTYNTEGMLLYNKTLGKHRINATIGGTYDNTNLENSWTVNEDFWTEDLRIYGLGNGAKLSPFFEDYTQTSILSALARVVYSYDNKYILTATGRADGTSRFSKGNKWGYFPSLAVAWRASEEDFIKDLNFFSTLKPRLGYGITGNQAISPYSTITRYKAAYYATDNESIVVGATPSLMANKNLTWESSSQINLGVDMGFLNDRITFTADLYDKKTEDLLQQRTLPTSTGFSTMWVNRGSIENKGLELAIDAAVISSRQFQWTVGGNIAFNRNKIVDIGLPEGEFGNMTLKAFLGTNVAGGSEFKMPANIFAEGYPIGMFFGYQTQGIYQQEDVAKHPLKLAGTPLVPGDIYFVDQNGDGNINAADKVIIGNPNPKFTYGFTTTASYKRFSLNVFINGVYGNQIANGNKLKIEDTQIGLNVTQDAYYKAWSPDQPNNPYPRLLYKNGDFTDRILENGSYLRVGMVTLGYRPNVKNVRWLSAFDVFVTGRNLLTLTNYSGYDSEVNSFTNDPMRMGVDWSSYPNTRSVVLGVNVTF